MTEPNARAVGARERVAERAPRESRRRLPPCHILALALLASIEARASTASEFAALHELTRPWADEATPAELGRLRDELRNIVACPDASYSEQTSANIDVGGHHFRYYTISVGRDAQCLFLVEPSKRPLTVAEARDLISAPLLQSLVDAHRVAAGMAEYRRNAEARFQALLALAGAREARNQPASERAMQRFVDCSAKRDGDDGRAGESVVGFFHAGAWSWTEIPTLSGVCIRVEFPLFRGLTASEAKRFIEATTMPVNEVGAADWNRRESPR